MILCMILLYKVLVCFEECLEIFFEDVFCWVLGIIVGIFVNE